VHMIVPSTNDDCWAVQLLAWSRQIFVKIPTK
jgi:hypothetical protein